MDSNLGPISPLSGSKHLCLVCGGRASSKYYGVYNCESCMRFFRLTARRKHLKDCSYGKNCIIDKTQGRCCSYCRYQKCLTSGMKLKAVGTKPPTTTTTITAANDFSFPPPTSTVTTTEQTSATSSLNALLATASPSPSGSDHSQSSAISKSNQVLLERLSSGTNNVGVATATAQTASGGGNTKPNMLPHHYQQSQQPQFLTKALVQQLSPQTGTIANLPRFSIFVPDKNFEGVLKGWNTPDFDVGSLATYCIIEPLCRIAEALPNEAKIMKETSWKTIINEFFVTNTICGNETTFLEIVSNANFERNLRSFNSSYEQYVLSVGEFDERILLNNPNYRKVNYFNDVTENDNRQDIRLLIPETPLTRKNSLPIKDVNVKESVANATNNVKKLQDIAEMNEPTEFVRNIGDACILNELLQQLSQKFENKFQSPEAQNRFRLAKSLYFYLLDTIVKVEERNKTNVDLKQFIGM